MNYQVQNHSWRQWCFGIQEKVLESLENASIASKNKYKKGELKENKVIVDGLQYHLLSYVGNLNNIKTSMISFHTCIVEYCN